ncbi:hypothetical protein [Legionella londiniensis]|uniref:Ankyrin repeat family transporter protein n=1 Tax=Legionella londiniensis TaxID=45068 RepID=A0A0W0VQL8_9GAMM|nr:hypothetical protein [Legionella londiniensis]KTD22450.1 ankyrin repeat family transporter protein [Legionella londiniensis]STX92977.1 ankyrin repeat family transporter protein [Legionella londiniensis]
MSLGESNPQDTYDLLIIPYANLLFGDKDLKELWEKLEPHSMSADDIKEIRQQSSPDDVKQMAIYKLLSCTEVLAYAESHLDQFQQYVDPYVDQYILTLMESIQINGSNGELIDLGESEANHVFYLLKNLIRRNEENHNLMISWLAAIPQIQNIVRRDLASEAQSELLRLAMSVRNETATEIMLNISMLESPSPETRTSGLWEIAQDKESSMKALTDVEQVILDRVYDHYRTKLDKEGGGQNFFKQFKEYLAKNYQKAPAYCMLADKKINLPLDWYDFKDLLADLKLNDHARKEFQAHALKAYYQHTAHTAYRFLSKPNHWMAKNASYVCGNPQRGQGYAYFEAYQEMIAYFWLAASDEETPAIDNFTIEERQAQFITSLALIGRAHNWDENRLKNKTFEEYDDLKGDNPSCYSGIKRRLFHSVLGHPMFKILTKEILAQELNSFVYNYYKKVISTDNSKLIRAELMKKFYLEEPGKNYIPFDLKKVDIEERQQAGFLKELEDKYGKQVNYFQKDISLFFNPKPCEYHIEKFYQQIEHLLDNPVNSQKSPMVFFATKRIPSQECNEQQPDNRYSKL